MLAPQSRRGLGTGLSLRGSEFNIRLPLAAAPDTSQRRSAADDEQTIETDHRILIVDDNVDAAETLCMLMRSLGEREVLTGSSGAQALKAAPELHPDIVLLDLGCPEMDGHEIARRMRNEPWGKSLMPVALSGWGQEEHRRRSKEAGFDQHMTQAGRPGSAPGGTQGEPTFGLTPGGIAPEMSSAMRPRRRLIA